jgi:hypothetical protein
MHKQKTAKRVLWAVVLILAISWAVTDTLGGFFPDVLKWLTRFSVFGVFLMALTEEPHRDWPTAFVTGTYLLALLVKIALGHI